MAIGVLKDALPVLPKPHDIDSAEKAAIEIAPFLARDKKKDIQFVLKRSDKKEIVFILTPIIVDLLYRTLVQIAKGNAVTLVPTHAELSTQEAANLLNVSRPYFIRLLDQGRIPYHRVGTHRRIMFEDLLKYKEKSNDKSRKAREELTREAQDLDLGY